MNFTNFSDRRDPVAQCSDPQTTLLRSFHRSLIDLIDDFRDQGLSVREMQMDLDSTAADLTDD